MAGGKASGRSGNGAGLNSMLKITAFTITCRPMKRVRSYQGRFGVLTSNLPSIRDPWDRQVSFYHQRHRRRRKPPSFEEFLYRDKRARLNNYDIYSLDGQVCLDFLGHYENLDEDLEHVLKRIGITGPVELPHVKSFTTVRVPSRTLLHGYNSRHCGQLVRPGNRFAWLQVLSSSLL